MPRDPLATPVTRMLEGFARGELLLPLDDAGKPFLYPRGQHAGEWQTACGAGVVYSFSVVHRPPAPEMAADIPYIVAIIQLAEGPHMMARLVSVDPETVRIGMPVRLDFATINGQAMPVFVPA